MRTKHIVAISLLAVCVAASGASAGGMNMLWNDCGTRGGGVGVANRSFACNSNTGINELYITFSPDLAIPDVNGVYAIVDLHANSTTLPDWWQFKNAGTCRQASLSAQVGLGTCPDPFSGQAMASIAAYFTQANAPQIVPAPNRARILAIATVSNTFAAPVEPGTEYMGMVLRIDNARTVGDGACAGCGVGLCIILNEVLLTSVNSGDNRLFAPIESHFATWQGGVELNALGCPGGSPALNRTWGQVKTLYR